MVRKPIAAPRQALASLLLLPLVSLLGACTPVPSATGEGKAKAGSGDAKPEDVCKHVRELADQDTDDAEVLDKVERECVETLAAMQIRYSTFTTCLELAADAKAVSECEKSVTKPRSLLAASGPLAKVEAVCTHVITMLEGQLAQAGSPMQPAELEELRGKCIEDAGAQVEVKGAEAFNKEADCILAADTIEALQACGM